jgi:hypothetical protein
MDLRVGKTRTNHKKGIAAASRLRKREEAEARNAEYQKLSLEEKAKHHRPGGKVWRKLKAAI